MRRAPQVIQDHTIITQTLCLPLIRIIIHNPANLTKCKCLNNRPIRITKRSTISTTNPKCIGLLAKILLCRTILSQGIKVTAISTNRITEVTMEAIMEFTTRIVLRHISKLIICNTPNQHLLCNSRVPRNPLLLQTRMAINLISNLTQASPTTIIIPTNRIIHRQFNPEGTAPNISHLLAATRAGTTRNLATRTKATSLHTGL